MEEHRGNGSFKKKPKQERTKRVLDKVDDDTKSQIRRTVHEYFIRNEPPTIDKILTRVNENESLPNFKRSTFHKLLLELKFR